VAEKHRASNEFQSRYVEALRLKRDGRLAEARDMLEALVAERPRYPASRGVLGGLLFELGEFSAAAREFAIVTVLSPGSELASLGLFHALLEAGRREDAIVELRRFTRSKRSVEYELFLAGLDDASYVEFVGRPRPS
jgi:predicted Zn-dependent protease